MTSLLRSVAAVFAILTACLAFAGPEDEVDALVSRMHEASKTADVGYFDLFADDAVFFGTDLWERWTKPEFEALYRPYMESGRGWEFKMRDRRIDVQPGGDIALFDETLFSESFGPCRGSGAARRDDGAWRIVRYHLDITIPNGVVDDVVPLISAYEASRVEVMSLPELPADIGTVADLVRAELPDVVVIGTTTDDQAKSLLDLVSGFKAESISVGLAGVLGESARVLYRVDHFDTPTRAIQYGDAPGSDFEYLTLLRHTDNAMALRVATSVDPHLKTGDRSALVWHEFADEPERWSTAETPDAIARSLWVPDTIEVTELETFRVGDVQIDRAILTRRDESAPPSE